MSVRGLMSMSIARSNVAVSSRPVIFEDFNPRSFEERERDYLFYGYKTLIHSFIHSFIYSVGCPTNVYLVSFTPSLQGKVLALF